MYAIKVYVAVVVQLHSFVTSVLDAAACSAPRSGRFIPRKELSEPREYENDWAPEPVWTIWREDKFL